jgi:hypothetical protein|tara:strand:- start:2230 stop:2580 length:351 start_codon:yes stop_codon:yes gene_type:complete
MIEIKFSMEDGNMYINGALTAHRGDDAEEEEDLIDPPYTFADLLTGDGLDKEEFICFMAVLRKCFPSMGDDGSEGTATDPILRITKQDVGSFVSGIDREVPLPDIGKFEFFPSEDV